VRSYPFARWRPTLGAKHMNTGITLRYPAQTRVSDWLDPYRYGWTQTSVRRDSRLKLKYPTYFPVRWVFRDAVTDVRI
jgi:hypothetical protein